MKISINVPNGVAWFVFSLSLFSMLPAFAGGAAAKPWLFTGLHPETWQGVRQDNGITVFKGLPFAAPPVGGQRWQPPAPYTPRPRQHIADEFAPACMQGSHTVDWYQDLITSLGEDPTAFDHPEKGYSEDCLYLNLWTPAQSTSENLPVMVWIHGGSNRGGWPFEPDYHGKRLAQQGVVVVSVAYRVGIFGFFSHPQLIAEQGSAGNYGLLDLIAGLQWVQRHIAAFGGDPSNVTVFGESAGAANIGYLMSAPEAAGLFQRAIHQSGGFQMNDTPELSTQTSQGVQVAHQAATDLDGLRRLSGERMLELVALALPGHSYSPAVAGHVLPRSPRAVFAAGDQHDVPLMIGTNANEWLMYLEPDQQLQATIDRLGLSGHEDDLRVQFDNLSAPLQMDRLETAAHMLCPSYAMASAVRSRGTAAWVYQLRRVREGARWEAQGAYHGAEIPYIFNTHAEWVKTTKADRQLTTAVQKYWVNFARSGNPNEPPGELPAWPQWNPDLPQVVVLDDPVQSQPAPDQWLCQLLDGS